MTLYHATKKKNLESILGHGLIPKIGELSANCGEKEERVYLFPGMVSMETALASWLGEWYEENYGDGIKLCSLAVILPDAFPICEGEVSYEKYSYITIPAEYVSYLRDE